MSGGTPNGARTAGGRPSRTPCHYFPRADGRHGIPESHCATLAGARVNANVFEDSVLPIIDAGLAELIDDGAETPGMRAWTFPGHTPGHMVLESRIETELHSSPATYCITRCRCPPRLEQCLLRGQAQAAAGRRHLLERASARGTRIVPAARGPSFVVRGRAVTGHIGRVLHSIDRGTAMTELPLPPFSPGDAVAQGRSLRSLCPASRAESDPPVRAWLWVVSRYDDIRSS